LLQTQDIAVILKKITETGAEAIKEVIDFTLKGLKYAVDQHAKNQGLVEADTLAVYGGNHCKKGLVEAAQGITLGFVRKVSDFPLVIKILDKIPGGKGKVVGGVGIFIWAVKDNWTDIANVDMMHCIAGFNKNGWNEFSSEEYTQPLSGDSNDYENF
jgi:hypothetical protein